MKKKLLISASGGESSMFMAQWLWNNKRDEYEMIFVFANTGQENEETYEFIEKCSKYFKFNVVWIEASVNKNFGVSTGHKIVDYKTADRDGKPFEDVIKKYGIPNQMYPHCTREAKLNPIKSYVNSIGWDNYYTAIGIRSDEADRISASAKENLLIYPLISKKMIPMTKQKINFWWSQQPFRLNLKGYEGNCKWCWKKSDSKLYTLAKENKKIFDFPIQMEEKYGNYIPKHRLDKMKKEGKTIKLPITFFRRGRSANQIIESSQKYNKKVTDDSLDMNYQTDCFTNHDLVGGESCEIYSECSN